MTATTTFPSRRDRPDFAADRMDGVAAAGYLGLKPSTLENDRCTQKLRIPFYKIGRRPYYRRSDLDAWIEARRVECAV